MVNNRVKNRQLSDATGGDTVKRKAKNSDSTSFHPICIRLVVFGITVICGWLHYMHVSQLHENDLFFSHLSSTERELTFRTEMGFYYSYFKQLILAPNLTVGWNSLLFDTRSEFPPCLNSTKRNITSSDMQEGQCLPLNAMQRFNLYPELILSTVYRLLLSFNLLHTECYQVSRESSPNPIALVVPPSRFAEAIQNNSTSMIADQTLRAADQPIISCIGLGDPAYFYTGVSFSLAGLNLVGLCLSGWLLAQQGLHDGSKAHPPAVSDQWLTVWGAVLPALGYFYNHREATRVQWSPPLRESFSYPFFLLQQAFLMHILTRSRFSDTPTRSPLTVSQTVTYCSLLLGFQLPWQFAQFALSTQIASLLAACCLAVAVDRTGIGSRQLIRAVRAVVAVHLIALFFSYVLQFGNALLLSSTYFPGLVGAWLGLSVLLQRVGKMTSETTDSVSCDPPMKCPGTSSVGGFTRLFNIIFLPCIVTVLTTMLLFALINAGLGVEQHDGGHIMDLLREKLQPGGSFHTFHTRLYTCAREFDFIEWTALRQPLLTGLLPVSVILAGSVLVSAVVQLFRSVCRSDQLTVGLERWTKSTDSDVPLTLRSRFVCLFVVIQLFFFTLMAVLIMRLKLFWTPQLCLTLALIAQPVRWHQAIGWLTNLWSRDQTVKEQRLPRSSSRPYVVHFLLVLLLAIMTTQGIKNLKEEWSIQGQFSSFNDEVLIDWFRSLPVPPSGPSTPWVIAGPLSTQGSLRLMLPSVHNYPSPQYADPDGQAYAGFAFTNHPHYENAELRYRTVLAYAIYSRKPVDQVWRSYREQLQANFVVVDSSSCYPRKGCSNPELYDLVDPDLVNRPALCQDLLTSNVLSNAVTPAAWKPFFDVVFVDLSSGRVVLYVHPAPRV